MLGRNGNIAYVRYDHQGRIVAGGPIIQARPPKNGNWQAVSNVLGTNTTGSSGSNVLRAFIRVDYFNRVVPSSLVLLSKEPGDNNSQTTWVEINAQYRGTTTTTTTAPIYYEWLVCTSGSQVTACTGCGESGGTTYVYTTTPSPTNNTLIFLDIGGTYIPYSTDVYGTYVKIVNQNIVYRVEEQSNVLTLGTNC